MGDIRVQEMTLEVANNVENGNEAEDESSVVGSKNTRQSDDSRDSVAAYGGGTIMIGSVAHFSMSTSSSSLPPVDCAPLARSFFAHSRMPSVMSEIDWPC